MRVGCAHAHCKEDPMVDMNTGDKDLRYIAEQINREIDLLREEIARLKRRIQELEESQ